MITSEELDEIRQVVTGLIAHMPLKLQTSVDQMDDEIRINIGGNDRAYLLTDHGETLLSLEYLLGKIIRQRFQNADEMQVFVDSDGFLFRHEEELRQLAHRTMERVRRERRPVKLPPMNPYERRIIHTEVSDSYDMESLSEGDGFIKQIVIRRGRR